MKTKLTLLLALGCLLFTIHCPAACTTVAETSFGTWDNHGVCTVDSVNTWQKIATKFTASASYTVCSAELYLFSFSKAYPTNYYHSFRVAVYSHNAGANEPNALVGTASDYVPALNIASTNSDGALSWSNTPSTSFTGLSASLTSGTTYWLVLEPNVTLASTNFPVLWKATGANWNSGLIATKGFKAASWSDPQLTQVGMFRLYQ
jgi:hypothetical protein